MKRSKLLKRVVSSLALAAGLGAAGAPAASALYSVDVMETSNGDKACEWGSGDWYLHGMKYYDSGTKAWYVCNNGKWDKTTR